ncbi:hypothetical protein P153DRAFT_429489 [Dothidotthia symphoricarpi CBS 119687]|uniref:Heterokaryon incompatibility domain-containing protein n=1 Tax=Dothidotthia symphoricarpi CBS 119687 TaxID=1392245 RepID=A0A6A6AN73_9PLEO|nr:uncharacterized protein P153DRAFT_429489 [Dothidotthia symphoricarpi CBS 119687]KAF2132337.1 hypothetical protein P153DRAFT_429489 [Dothidotthia symphoricarpi CBS 119687]
MNESVAGNPADKQSQYPPHQYQRLSSAHSIQLFRLTGFNPKAKQFHGNFFERNSDDHTVSEAHNTKYTALSYTWGAAIEGENEDVDEPWIVVIHETTRDDDGTEKAIATSIAIQQNLATYLKALSSFHMRNGLVLSFAIWIDAISIDQTNDEERTIQISLMGNIYREALQVHIWLGESNSNWEAFMWIHLHVLPELRSFYDLEGVTRCVDMMSGYDPIKEEFWDKYMPHLQPLDMGGKVSWKDCWESYWYFLYERRWFRRAWTYQEVLLARHPSIICGPSYESVSFDSVAIISSLLLKSGWGNQLNLRFPSYKTVENGPHIMPAYIGREKNTISKYISETPFLKPVAILMSEGSWVEFWSEICYSMQNRECTFMEDRIHATIGIMNAIRPPSVSEELLQEPKGMSVEQMYYWAGSLFLRKSLNLNYLSYIGQPSKSNPGWIVNHSRMNEFIPIANNVDPFDACPLRYHRQVTIVDNTLIGAGVKVDTIRSCSYPHMLALPEWCLYYSTHLSQTYHPCAACQSSIEAVWRTLVWNHNRHRISAEDSWGGEFKEWLESIMIIKFLLPKFRAVLPGEGWEQTANEWLQQVEFVGWKSNYLATPSIRVIRAKIACISKHPAWPSVRAMYTTSPSLIELSPDVGAAIEPFRDVLDKAFHSNFYRELARITWNRKLIGTRSGYIGMAHNRCEIGDEIWLLAGGQVPYVLRPCDAKPHESNDSTPRYTFQGDCYIHGIMEGEFFEGKQQDEISFETVHIL